MDNSVLGNCVCVLVPDVACVSGAFASRSRLLVRRECERDRERERAGESEREFERE